MNEKMCNHYDTGGICCSDGAFKYKYCKDINDCYYKQLQTAKEKNDNLTQQNKQMREALEKIVDIKNSKQIFYSSCDLDVCFDIAQQALKGGE